MQRARDVGDVVFRRAEHDFRRVSARKPAQHPQEIIAVHLRHVPVEQDRIRQLPFAALDGFLAVFGFHDLEFETFKDPTRHLTDDARVVDNQTRLHNVLTPSSAGEPASISAPRIFKPSRRSSLDAKIKYSVDIENDKKLVVEPINPRRNPAQITIEIDWIGLALAVRQLEYLADRIDEKAKRLALRFDTDRHRNVLVVASAEAKTSAQIDCRNDAAAQIEHSGNFGSGE